MTTDNVKKIKYAFRITHIDNIAYIEKCGLTRSISPLRDPSYIGIGDRQVINIRSCRFINKHQLSDYIPFYFGPRSPMLYVIQHGYNGVQLVAAEDIVYCVIRLEDLVDNDIDCVFTDGHALSALTSFYPKEKLALIDNYVKIEDVFSTQWNIDNDIDLKRRKEAELLVNNDLGVQYIKGYVVYNEAAMERLISIGVASEKIVVRQNYYF